MKNKKSQNESCGIHEGKIHHPQALKKAKEHMPDRGRLRALADLYKNFSDYTRIRILLALECGELCVCDIAALLYMSVSAVSHQLKVLRMSNLVSVRREGRSAYYSLADEHVKSILRQGFEHINE